MTVAADAMNTIDSVAVAASFSLAASSGTVALSGAGSGAVARNTTTNQVLAEIVDLDRHGGPRRFGDLVRRVGITSDTASVAASISVSSGVALSGVVAITLAENQIGGTYRATITDVIATALGGDVTVSADANNTIDALGLAIGISVSAGSSFALPSRLRGSWQATS